MQELQPGLYRHYKGGNYQVIGVARHSETDDLLVVYRCLYDNNSLWVRPLAMFLETVIIDGRTVPRFERYDTPDTVHTKEYPLTSAITIKG